MRIRQAPKRKVLLVEIKIHIEQIHRIDSREEISFITFVEMRVLNIYP